MRNGKILILCMIFIFIFIVSCMAKTDNVVTTKPVSTVKGNNVAIPAIVKDIPVSIIYATGRGAPPADDSLTETQKYLLAERAAIVDGYRVLSEKLEGMLIEAFTKAGLYEVYADKITIYTQSFIKGAEIIEIKHKNSGICEAVIKISFNKNKI